MRLRLTSGRHRVLARLVQPEASIRVLDPAGRPAKVRASGDQGASYEVLPPELLPDPNVLEPFLRKLKVPAVAGVPAPIRHGTSTIRSTATSALTSPTWTGRTTWRA